MVFGQLQPNVGHQWALHENAWPISLTILGEPLVDHRNDLRRLELDSPVWIDRSNKQVVGINLNNLREM